MMAANDGFGGRVLYHVGRKPREEVSMVLSLSCALVFASSCYRSLFVPLYHKISSSPQFIFLKARRPYSKCTSLLPSSCSSCPYPPSAPPPICPMIISRPATSLQRCQKSRLRNQLRPLLQKRLHPQGQLQSHHQKPLWPQKRLKTMVVTPGPLMITPILETVEVSMSEI